MSRLTPNLLLSAYCEGIFPMAHGDGQIYWYDPDPRAIIPLERVHVSRRLARTIRGGGFVVRVNTAFAAVMHACAAPASGRGTTWISEEIMAAYEQLHKLGFAHSVETWRDGRLVGGLYGVAVQGLFAGESMFSAARDGSKVALVNLTERLRHRGFQLLDIQFMTDHLRRFGAVEISAAEYKERLAQALMVPARFVEP